MSEAVSQSVNQSVRQSVSRQSVSQPVRQTRGLISKEIVVLRRWGRETQNFGFMN